MSTRLTQSAIAALALLLAISGCRLKDDAAGDASAVPAPADVAAPPADALRTSSGLASKVLRVGIGQARPGPRAKVVVNYTGWTTDGHMFETNHGIEFPVDGVIKGWTEGLQLMVVGEKRRFWIPSELAYGDGMRVFDIELLTVR